MQELKSILTVKEYDTWILLSKGFLYKEIAATQGVTIDTIKKHCKNIYKKLRVRNRTEALRLFLSNYKLT